MRTDSNTPDGLIGVGLYPFPEAARIIGVKPSTLRRWAKEYWYTSRGTTYLHHPLIPRHFGADASTITFLELIEFLFVKLFRVEGVSMPAIRKAAQRAAEMFGTPYPFAMKRFDTDGTHIFVTLQTETDDQRAVEDLTRGQRAFETVVRAFFRKIDYQGDTAALRFWPLEHGGRVVLDPQRAFGRPIDAETGIATETLFDAVMAGGGQSPAEVAAWFNVPIAAVDAAVTYERMLLEESSPLAA
jgi:uncharacterized protein (DUF433 family)